MIATNTTASSKATVAEKPVAKPAKQKRLQGPRMEDGSREAKRQAAAILEVIGGARTPTDAAQALGISLPRYYLLESRALSGLLSACEPRPIGRVRTAESELALLQKENRRLQQECARYTALVRVAQRTIGLSAPPPPKAQAEKGKRRKRKATVRALKAAVLLQSGPSGEAEAVLGGDQPAKE